MTSRHLLARSQRLLATVVLVMSGAYMLIYLYRWEWNRAIISGLFFLAAQIALATSMILRRLQALERGSVVPADPRVLDRIRSTPVDRPDPFRWLRPRATGVGVFVPVLLGAGVILSALAYVIERIAEATALPSVDRRLARRMSALGPPPGHLHGELPALATPPPRTAMSLLTSLIALVGIAVMGWIGVGTLLEATQTRPDPSDRPARTTIELRVSQRGVDDGTVEAAEALWVGCRSTLGSLPTAAAVVPGDGDHVRVVLEPGIGRLTTRRLAGCLSDLRVNLVRASVVDVDHVAAP
jgi:hypothetical protein